MRRLLLALFLLSTELGSTDRSRPVEEIQQFTQLHSPTGPSSHVVRLTVPQTCCAEAARVLVRALGGEREAKRVVGGVRWWQVRPGDGGYVACSLPPRERADVCVRIYAGSKRSGSWIRETGRRRSAVRRPRRRRHSGRAGTGVRLPSQRRHQVRTDRLVRGTQKQTGTVPRWTRCGVFCGHTEVGTHTLSVRALPGAYRFFFTQEVTISGA